MSKQTRRAALPDGVYPTIITPFLDDEEKSVDWDGLDFLVEWYIKGGVAGLFAVCLSSEMFQLTSEERVGIAKRVSEKVAGRVKVVAGATFEGTLEDQAKLMNDTGRYVDAVVIITNQIGKMEDSDKTWMANVEKLMELTGDLSLGVYETPIPKVRSLSPEIMTWLAKTGRFVFHKDTSLHLDTLLDKVRAVRAVPDTPFKIFSATAQFLKTLLDNGGNGFSGVCPNFYPWLVVWLCEHQNESEAKRSRMQRFISVTDRILEIKHPASTKFYLSNFYGVPIKRVSRITDAVITDQDAMALQGTKDMVEEISEEYGITPVNL